MKKKKFKLLSIMIIALLAMPQNAIATIPNNTVTFDTNGKTIYFLDKNGVRQTFTQDSQGAIIPGSVYSAENTMLTNSNTNSTLTTNNPRKSSLKDELIQQSNDREDISNTNSTSEILDEISMDKSSKDKIKKLKDKPSELSNDLLIKFKDSTLELVKTSVLSKHSLKSKGKVKSKNIELVTLSKNGNINAIINTLKSDPNVASVQPNFKYYAENLPTDPLFIELWGLKNSGQTIKQSTGISGIDINVLDAWNTSKGDPSVVVGVIDTGIDINHPDLTQRIWSNAKEIPNDGIDNDNNGYIDDVNGWDFYNNDNTVFDWEDGDRHGTHVSGTIAASMNNEGIIGVAPNVKIMPLKFLGPQGGSTYDAIRAIEYAKSKGVKILNNSWGGSAFDQLLRDSIASSGTIFITAAGNDSINNDLAPHYPSSYDCDNILSVAAISNKGNLSYFSNWGATSVDVAAPGEAILSSVPKNAAFGASILSSNTLFQGFGLEILNSDLDRQNFMEKSLNSLGIKSTSKILLVQDDASDKPNYLNCLNSYKLPLTALGYSPTVITVPSSSKGPALGILKQYDLVIWFTGNDVVSLTPADQSNLMGFLDKGGKLFLSGRDAGYSIENTTFYEKYLHSYFIDEASTKASIYAGANNAFSEDVYEINKKTSIDYLKPSDSMGQVVLRYTPDADYANAYDYYNGTSMATPHVTGIAALLLSKQPSQDPLIIKQNIMKSVTSLPSTSGKTVTGGLVDATKALSLSDIPLDNNLPGVEIKEINNGTLDQSVDLDDVYSVKLNGGETIILNLQGVPTENTDFDLHLYSPKSISLTDTSEILVSSEQKNTSNEKITFTATKAGTYYVDVYAYAGVGSYTLSKASELIYDDASSALKYVGNWSTDVNASNEGGSAKVINGSGSVSLSFTGSSVKWTGFKDPKQGTARVVIDGATQAEVDLYAPSPLSKQLLFEKSLNFGQHVMEIQWAGIPNKNDKAKKKDPYINIDTIKINTSSPKASAPTITSTTGYASNISLTFKNNDESADKFYIYKSIAGSDFKLVSTYDSLYSEDQEFWFEDTEVLNNVIYSYYVTAVNTMGESVPSNTVTASKLTTNSVYNAEDTNSNMEYTGTWNLEADSTYSGGTRHVTVEAGAKVSIPFTALESRIKLMSGPDMGIARIYWSNAIGDYYDANLNAPSADYLTFGTSSNIGIMGNWVIECVSGKVSFDVENIWDYTNVAPKAPANLKGILENTSISLNWDANIEFDLKSYNVYRSNTSGSGFSLINSVPLTNTHFTDTSIIPEQDCYYVVKAVNYANLESNASTEIIITHPIVAPAGFTGKLTGTSAELNWTKHSDPAVKQYNVYRSTTPGSNYELLNTLSNEVITYKDSTALPGIPYYYVLTAVSGTGVESNKSKEVTVMVPQIITTPTGLIGTLSGTSVVLNWTKHSDSAVEQYNIYRTSTSGLNYQLLDTVSNEVLTYTDSTIVAGTTYYYAITAVSTTDSESVKSNEVTVMIPATEPVTVPPSGRSTQRFEESDSNIIYTGTWISGVSSAFSDGTAKLSNTTNSYSEFTFIGTGIKWISYLSSNRGKANVYIDDNLISTVDTYSASPKAQRVTFEKLDLPAGSHKIKIVVTDTKNAASIGNFITVDAFDVILPISAPIGITGALSGSSVLLNWIKHSDPDVTEYKVYRTTTPGSNYQLLSTITNPTLTYKDSTVVAGTTYYYTITAVSNTASESDKSNEVTFMVPATVPTSGGDTQRFEQSNTSIVYSGTWISGSSSAFSDGTAKLSNVTNSYSEFTFTGTGIRWISYFSSNRGKAEVYIDEELNSTVDTYSASAKAQKVAFEKLDLPSGSHTIKIVVTDTRNAASIGNFITVDAFDVLTSNGVTSPNAEVTASVPTGLTGTLSESSALLNWTKHSDPSVTQYKVYRTTTPGSNYQLLNTVSNAILTYTDSTVVTGTAYYYAISAISSTGFESLKSNEVTVMVPTSLSVGIGNVQRFEETNSNIIYGGTWTSGVSSSFSEGTAKLSKTPNSYFEFTFTGTGIKWISYLSSNRGQADVYIDGNLISTVDTYSSSAKAQKVAFEKLDLLTGSHTIKIVVTATRNAASIGNFITIDALDVMTSNEATSTNPEVTVSAPASLTGKLSGSSALLSWAKHSDPDVTEYKVYRTTTLGSNYQLLSTITNPILNYTDSTVVAGTTYYYAISAVSNAGSESSKSNEVKVIVPTSVPVIVGNKQRFEDTSSNIVYTGSWTSGVSSSFSEGTAKLSKTPNSYFEFTFTGTGIRWITYLSSNRGQAEVYIDDNLISTVDTYSSSAKAQKVAFEKLDLPAGSHTIKIVVTDTRNAASIGNFITIDALDVMTSNEVISTNPEVTASAPSGLTGKLSGSSALLSWTKHSDPDVTEYKVYRTTTSGSNYQLLSTITNPILIYTDSAVVAGTTYYYAISAVSSTVSESPKSNEVTVIFPTTVPVIVGNTQRFEDTSSDIVYTGTWTSGVSSSFSEGSAKLSKTPNSYFEFTFTGTGIRWITYLSSNRGQADVYIDGNLISTVDTYSSSVKSQKVAFEKLDLPAGSHTIKIVVTDTRNAASIGNFITIDALEVLIE